MRPKEMPPRSAKKVVVVAIMPILRLRSANTWRISYQELLARRNPDESTWDEFIGSKDPTLRTSSMNVLVTLTFYLQECSCLHRATTRPSRLQSFQSKLRKFGHREGASLAAAQTTASLTQPAPLRRHSCSPDR